METKLTIDQLPSEYPNTFVVMAATNPLQHYAFNTASFNPRSHTQYVWRVVFHDNCWNVDHKNPLEWGNKCPVDIVAFVKSLGDDTKQADLTRTPEDYEPKAMSKANKISFELNRRFMMHHSTLINECIIAWRISRSGDKSRAIIVISNRASPETNHAILSDDPSLTFQLIKNREGLLTLHDVQLGKDRWVFTGTTRQWDVRNTPIIVRDIYCSVPEPT